MFGIGSLFSLVSTIGGIGMQYSASQKEAKAEKDMAQHSMMISLAQANQQHAQFALYRTMQTRLQEEAGRRAQAAEAQGFAAGINQGGSAFGLSSAAGGERGQVRGEESVAKSNIGAQIDFATQFQHWQDYITGQKMAIAQDQSQIADAKGQAAEGAALMGIGKAFGSVFGGAGTLSSLFPGGGGGGDVGLGTDIENSIFNTGTTADFSGLEFGTGF